MPFAVNRIYGIKLGRVKPEIAAYAAPYQEKNPDIALGFFGRRDQPICYVFKKESFTECFDGFAGTSESMCTSFNEMAGIDPQWDRDVMWFVEDIGYHDFGFQDVQWHVVVTEFGPG